MLRLIDVFLAICGLVFGSPIFLVVLLLGFLDTGSPLFFQPRVGRRQQVFTLVKFRTMHIHTASVATHLADVSAVTPLGHFLRKSKLDELPQLWNVLKGEMSLVGPRPCLPSQTALIAARDALGVFNARPGVTGLAQVNGIDMSNPQLLSETDARMLDALTLASYFKYILLTLMGKGAGDRINAPRH